MSGATGRIGIALAHELKLQRRQGFWAVYAVLLASYLAILRVLDAAWLDLLLPVLLFTECGVLGLFFVGGLVLLEKSEGTLEALFTTPLRGWEYLCAKVLSLVLLALAAGAGIALVAQRAQAIELHWPLLLSSLGLTAGLFTLLGLAVVSRVPSVNAYFLAAGLLMAFLCLPLVETVDLFSTPLFRLLPAWASIRLLQMSLGSAWSWSWLLWSLLSLVAWTLALALWARAWFEGYVVGRRGGRA